MPGDRYSGASENFLTKQLFSVFYLTLFLFHYSFLAKFYFFVAVLRMNPSKGDGPRHVHTGSPT